MADFVLVHGAWHGGWCWRRVVEILAAEGHRVLAPSLTGLGDRAHLLTPEVGLARHVDDVLAVIETEELSEVVLCGHSYGGAVATQVADRVPGKIGALQFLDALLPEDGRSLLDLDTPERRQAILSRVVETPHGPVIPAAPAIIYALASPDDVAWVDRRCVPQPLCSFADAAVVTGAWWQIPVLAYACTMRFQPPDFRDIAAQLAKNERFRVSQLACGHDAMIDLPQEVARLLLSCAEAAQTLRRPQPGIDAAEEFPS
jgi:pimeloyl-ACP methyl ester carboxylesterase